MTAARGRRLEPDERREQILDCAVRLFGERPYSAVSTVDIAHEAGVARGLLNHYFGTKRDLYLSVVRRMVVLPDLPPHAAGRGPLRERVERSVDWFLDAVALHAATFVAVTGAGGVGDDPAVEQILAEADDAAARAVLDMMGVPPGGEDHVAVVRAFGGLVKAAVREWVRAGSLTRAQVRTLLVTVLLTVVRDVLPELPTRPIEGAQ